jgi:transposase-like protein
MYQEPEVVPSAEEIESKREAIRQRKAAGESVEAIARDTGLTQMYVRRV